MNAYLWTTVIIGIFAFVLRMIMLVACEWPRKREPVALGTHVFEILLGCGFTIWAWVLLYFQAKGQP